MKLKSHRTLKDPYHFSKPYHFSMPWDPSLNMTFGVDKAHSMHTVPATPGRSLPTPQPPVKSLRVPLTHTIQRFKHTRGEETHKQTRRRKLAKHPNIES